MKTENVTPEELERRQEQSKHDKGMKHLQQQIDELRQELFELQSLVKEFLNESQR